MVAKSLAQTWHTSLSRGHGAWVLPSSSLEGQLGTMGKGGLIQCQPQETENLGLRDFSLYFLQPCLTQIAELLPHVFTGTCLLQGQLPGSQRQAGVQVLPVPPPVQVRLFSGRRTDLGRAWQHNRQ